MRQQLIEDIGVDIPAALRGEDGSHGVGLAGGSGRVHRLRSLEASLP